MTKKTTRRDQASTSGTPVDLEVLLNILFSGRTIILATLLGTVVATAVLSIGMPRRYEASVKLMAEPRREQGLLAQEIRSYQDRKVFLETTKELMVSKTVLTQTVARLENRPENLVSPRQADELADQIALRSRAGLGRSLIGGDGIGETSTFFVTAHSNSPETAARIANTLVETFLELNNKLRNDQVDIATRTLRATVEESTAQVKESHEALVAFETEVGPLLPELMSIDKENIRVFPELESLRGDFELGEIELAEMEERAAILAEAFEEAAAEEFPVIPAYAFETVPALKTLMERATQLQLKVNERLPFYLEESREVMSLREEIDFTRLNVLELGRTLHASEQQAVRAMSAKQAARSRSLAGYDVRLSQLSRQNSRYQELKRDYQAKARALDSQLQALAEARSAAAENMGGNASITVIDRAEPNSVPVAPRPLRNMGIAVLVGFLLGILAVLARQFSRPVFVHPRQVEHVAGLPVIGILNEEVKA